MFLNKVKEQQEKNSSFSSAPASHYQTALLTIPAPGTKTDGGAQAGSAAHLHPPHCTQNMLSVPSTGIMTAGEEKPLDLSQLQTVTYMTLHQLKIRTPMVEAALGLVLKYKTTAMH